MQRILVIGAITVAALTMTRSAEACGCASVYNATREYRLNVVRQALEWADIVFVGEVVGTDRTSGTLSVERMWKGSPLEKVRMRHLIVRPDGRLEGNSCTQTYSVGKHVVFGKQVAPGLWVAGVCGPGGETLHRGEVLEFLDELCRTEVKCTGRGHPDLDTSSARQQATQPNLALHPTPPRRSRAACRRG